MKLSTPVQITTPPFTIEPHHRVLVVGSCFAENIGEHLALLDGERITKNPTGVMYNPLSVARSVEIFRTGEHFSHRDLVEYGGLWHSMDFHGSFSSPSPEQALLNMNSRGTVPDIDVVVVTLGTAFVYFREGRVVANCHKMPEREFQRRRITVEESSDALRRIYEAYPNARFVVSLSPIRHLRDGLEQNSLSKATLRLALAEFCEADPERRVYFAANEILLDELRDYRFTATDMCHPTEQAREIIWERFAAAYLSAEYQQQLLLAQKEARRRAHRPLR